MIQMFRFIKIRKNKNDNLMLTQDMYEINQYRKNLSRYETLSFYYCIIQIRHLTPYQA